MILKDKGGKGGTVQQLQTSQKTHNYFSLHLFLSHTLLESDYLHTVGENLIDTANWKTHSENFSTKPVDPN